MGSALRALSASRSSARRFDHFTLIDSDKPSCIELESVVDSDFPEMKDRVNVLCEDANAALDEYIGSMDWGNTRALVFLDPYGLEVRWGTIMRLAGTGACDVWYLFPLGGVIRMMRNDGQIPDTWQARLDQLFGTLDWYDEFYSTGRQESLFGDEHDLVYKDASTQQVVSYVRERLLTTFPAVSKAGILRNRKGSPLFALVLGISNPGKPAQNVALGIGNHLVKDLTES
ncbi:MAG: three-Cys-motif partner protein TcmP [Actinobacteria bacterium]|nr:three-Cys-motif partner protein TcmP [Actinomycetota bacterium]